MRAKRLISLIFIFILSLGVFNLALAQNGNYDFSQNSGLSNTGNKAGYKTTYTKINDYIAQIITVILSLVGVVFLGLAIYAGIIWMTASGSEEKVSKAKEMLTESIIGIIIVLAAYAISYFILKATSGSLIQ